MSQPCIPVLLCMVIVFAAVIAVPVAADNVTPTATVTATSTTVPVTTTTAPHQNAERRGKGPTSSDVRPNPRQPSH